jgi:hypothetical protein
MKIMAARGVNEIENIGEFLRRWLSPEEPERIETRSLRSMFGNINLAGSVGASRSALLSHSDNHFFDSIEPGVRDLTRAFLDLRAITYTSCEGHLYDSDTADELHVGVLVRNNDEALRFERHWDAADKLVTAPIELGIMNHSVMSRGRMVRAIDFYLLKSRDSLWSDYFAALPEATRSIAASLANP